MTTTREDLLAAKCGQIRIPAPELGKDRTVLVQEPDGETFIALEDADYPIAKDGSIRLNRKGRFARWVIACARNDDGSPAFSEGDAAAVARMPGGLQQRIFEAAKGLMAGREPVMDAAKNSPGAQTDSSPSA